MSKKALTVIEPVQKMVPAATIGVQNNFELAKSILPKEFQGTQFEVIDTGLPPTVKWGVPGNYVAGVYEGNEQDVGPNKSTLYHFDAKGKKFSVWGTAVLDRVFQSGEISIGDLLLITYIGDMPTDLNPCKLFDVRKATLKSA